MRKPVCTGDPASGQIQRRMDGDVRKSRSRARKHFGFLIPFTIGIIFVLLFVDVRFPQGGGVVLLTVPFSMIGSLLALWIRECISSVSAGVGLTSLFGVAVMHGVIMVSYIQHLRKEGMESDRKGNHQRGVAPTETDLMTASCGDSWSSSRHRLRRELVLTCKDRSLP